MSLKENLLSKVQKQSPNEPEFYQAVEEFFTSIEDFYNSNPEYSKHAIAERLLIPERIIQFKITWIDDAESIQVNNGYRVQFNSAIGPYKGGLRFHPSVNLSVLKFLGFEQIFKNSLTDLPIGGGKGGSDFDPKDKSDWEVMRFTQSFMNELFRHIGADVDVPAGDIGVGGREIGYLYGQYKRLSNEFTGVLTGKNIDWGGSHIRPEATGYGVVYFLQEMLSTKDEDLKGKKVLISGSGNVAQYAAEQVNKLGGKVITLSDSSGYIFSEEGFSDEQIEYVKFLKNEKRGRIKEVAEEFKGIEYISDSKPWSEQADIALPCATQNEIDEKDAKILIKNGVFAVSEGANMPSTNLAISEFHKAKILYAPGKASNAGGVAVSGLEMSQQSMRIKWSREKVDEELQKIMKNIHQKCVQFGKSGNYTNYVEGANIAGFKKVADAMIAQGVV